VSVLEVGRPAPDVALLTLNRPAKRNALSAELMGRLTAAFDDLAADGATRCAVVTGAPPAFCAGGDLSELLGLDVDGYLAYCGRYRDLALQLEALPFPVIAAVNGPAVAGGFELMCLCDLRIAADGAVMAVGDVDIGLPPTSGLSWLLPRLVGPGAARRLALASPRIGTVEALAIGLVDEVAADAVVRALELAGEIAAKPGDGVRLTRQLLAAAPERSYRAAMDAELAAQREAFANPEARAAIEAFFARRVADKH
jgi:enoyl-CoA hydratase/carnithine racemase